jgi:hypothetical protein
MALSEDSKFNSMFERAKREALSIKTIQPMDAKDAQKSLMFWWSKHYNRPMKDPLLSEYSLYDLLLEFHLHKELDPESTVNEAITDNKEEIDNLVKEMDDDFMKKEFGDSWSMNEKDF